MKISDMTEALAALRNTHGNIPVVMTWEKEKEPNGVECNPKVSIYNIGPVPVVAIHTNKVGLAGGSAITSHDPDSSRM